jgi:hypothetical protein
LNEDRDRPALEEVFIRIAQSRFDETTPN